MTASTVTTRKATCCGYRCLRSPEWPDPHADEGHHEFTYSLYPHGGGWKEALTVRQGYELNYKLIARSVEKHQGALAAEHSFLQAQQDNIIVTAMKKAEDENALVVRFYEWAGKDGDVTLQLPPGGQSAVETNLMEKPTGKRLIARWQGWLARPSHTRSKPSR